MILIYALCFILGEAIVEGLLKRFSLAEFIFDDFVQWVIAIFLFGVWFIVLALSFDTYYVPIWKLILGFIFVRFLVFDIVFNLAWGQRWFYYGTKKLYDRVMTKLGSWGWFMKLVCGIVGTIFLLGVA